MIKAKPLAKAVTWRLVASFTTGVVSWAVTGSFAVAGSIVAVEFWAKIVAYYAHERAWDV